MRVSAGSWTRIAFALWLTGLVAAAFWSLPLAAATFAVTSTADVPDVNPGDGVCETAAGNHVCTLRAAIQEANAHAGVDTITLQANATYLLTRVGAADDTALNGDLDILDSVSIIGAGPASTIIDGNGAVTNERVLQIVRCIGNATPNFDGSCDGDAYVVVTISGVTVQNGHATQNLEQFGGGIYNLADLTLDNCVVTGNTANYTINNFAGGIFNSGTLAINRSVVSNNTTGSANAHGGGIMNNVGPVTITDSTISGNITPGTGGGIFGGSFKIVRSTISGNHGGVGGGMYAAGTNVLINSTVSGNDSDADGGGIYVSNGTTALYNVTVTKNRANADDAGSAVGGGVTNAAGATLTFNNSVIAGNELVVATMPFPTLDLDECSGTITSQGHSLLTYVQPDYCTVAGPYTNTTVALGPLQNNGGYTQTHGLPDGSAAIDAGDPSGCTDNLGAPITTDQRGVPRPYGAACDAGAFEAAEIIFRNGFESL